MDELRLLWHADWKKAAGTDPASVDGVGLIKAEAVVVKAIDQEARTVESIISTGAVDRDGDTIAVKGWQLKNYRRNPVVLFGHDHRTPAIARSPKITNDGETLSAIDQFPQVGVYPFADMIFSLIGQKILSAKSVGFAPIEFARSAEEARAGGYDFTKQELLEHSWVNVPSNPEALRTAAAKGIDLQPMAAWAERALDDLYGPGLWLPRKAVEETYRIATKDRSVHHVAALPDATDTKQDEPPADDVTKGAIPPHSTATVDAAFDGPAAEARIPNDAGASTLRKMYAYVDPSKNPNTKAAYKYGHHQVSSDGKIGAANVRGCITGIAELNGARGGPGVSDKDRPGVWKHLAKHLRDAKRTPPPLKIWEDGETAAFDWAPHLAAFTLEERRAMHEAITAQLENEWMDWIAAFSPEESYALAAALKAEFPKQTDTPDDELERLFADAPSKGETTEDDLDALVLESIPDAVRAAVEDELTALTGHLPD